MTSYFNHSTSTTLSSASNEFRQAQLRQLLGYCFSLDEVKTLAFDIEIDFDELEGSAKSSKIRELILFAERSAKTDALVMAAKKERPQMSWDFTASPSTACPYRGLAAFEEQHASLFFGREKFVEQLETAVLQHELTAVVGSSGSGKSSVVFAGLLPRLRQQGEWCIAHFRPNAQPFDELARSLIPLLEAQMSETDRLLEAHKLGDGLKMKTISLWSVLDHIAQKDPTRSRFLLVVDQFEEIYSAIIDDPTRRLFVDVLLELIKPSPGRGRRQTNIKLVLTLRADFMGRVLDYRPLATAFQNRDLKLAPMSPQELEAAIRRPAKQANLRFGSGLVERILQDLIPEDSNQMDASNLPLLEFALAQLWTLRSADGLMTREAYEAIGEVGGAISHYADEFYEGLSPEQQITMRRLLVQMVHTGGVEDTRRWVTRNQIGNAMWELIDDLAAERLVVTDRDGAGQDIAEVIHESLIQKWGRMLGWMKEDRPFRTWQDQMHITFNQWQKSQHDDDLLSGTLLSLSQEWIQKRPESLTEMEVSFIQHSFAYSKEQKRRNFSILIFDGSVGAAISAGLLAVIVAMFLWRPDDPEAYNLPLSFTVLILGLFGFLIGGSQGIGTILGFVGYAILKRQSINLYIFITTLSSGITGWIVFLLLGVGGAFAPGLSFISISMLGFFIYASSSAATSLAIIMMRKRYALQIQIVLVAVSAALSTFIAVWLAYQLFDYSQGNIWLESALGYSLAEGFLCGGMALGLEFATRQGYMPSQVDDLSLNKNN